MADVKIILRIEGDETVIHHFDQTAVAALDLKPPLNMIFKDMLRIEEAIFFSNGRRGGGSWKRLKPATIKKKGHDAILFDKGELFDSLTEEGAKYQKKRITNTSLLFGTDRPGAMTQQRGNPKKNIPARPFIRFTSYDTAKWGALISDHLLKTYAN